MKMGCDTDVDTFLHLFIEITICTINQNSVSLCIPICNGNINRCYVHRQKEMTAVELTCSNAQYSFQRSSMLSIGLTTPRWYTFLTAVIRWFSAYEPIASLIL